MGNCFAIQLHILAYTRIQTLKSIPTHLYGHVFMNVLFGKKKKIRVK